MLSLIENYCYDNYYLNLISAEYNVIPTGRNSGNIGLILMLGGCSYRCIWCDVRYSFEKLKQNDISLEKIFNFIQDNPAKIIFISGGEPLEQYSMLLILVNFIFNYYKNKIQIELDTSGLVDFLQIKNAFVGKNLRIICDLKLSSSGYSENFNKKQLTWLDYNDDLIVPIGSESDMEEFLSIIKTIRIKAQKYLMPINNMIDPKFVLEFILKNKLFDCSLLIRKFLSK